MLSFLLCFCPPSSGDLCHKRYTCIRFYCESKEMCSKNCINKQNFNNALKLFNGILSMPFYSNKETEKPKYGVLHFPDFQFCLNVLFPSPYFLQSKSLIIIQALQIVLIPPMSTALFRSLKAT